MTQPNQTLMFAYDYYPGQSLQVITRLQQSVTDTILGDQEVVSDASEWNSYIANYRLEGDTPGEYVLVFTRGGQLEDSFDLGASATFFNDEYNLLEVTVSGDGGGDGTPTPGDETPTPENGDGTPTPEDGGTPTPEDGGTPTPEPGGDDGNGGNGGGDGGNGGA